MNSTHQNTNVFAVLPRPSHPKLPHGKEQAAIEATNEIVTEVLLNTSTTKETRPTPARQE